MVDFRKLLAVRREEEPMEGSVSCKYCGLQVKERGMFNHLRNSINCRKIQRIAALCDQHMVLCNLDSPIYSWVSFHMEKTPIWEFDDELPKRPWVPSWFAELWFRASRSPVTGRLDCYYQVFLDTVLATIQSERRMNALAVQARLRDVGYFGTGGGIYKSDMTTPLWAPRESMAATQDDYNRAASGMLSSVQPAITTSK